MDNKLWYKSKTLWFNIATGVVISVNEMSALLEFVQQDTAMTIRLILSPFTITGNIILRFITEAKLTTKEN